MTKKADRYSFYPTPEQENPPGRTWILCPHSVQHG
ncbi:transposase IS605 family [Arthrospira platensis C1]|nr:transposase IS605 family [Arthrospira platensis C1]